MKKIEPDMPCVKCGKGQMKFIISLKETYEGIDNFDCQVIIIRQCDKCKEVEYDMGYGPEPSKVEYKAVKK
jgi:hypothetical protein